MRKNKTMGIAAALLVATLLTTSMISGTFAKYTSTGTGSDSARVAKWGVTVTANGNTFAKEYDTDDTKTKATITKSVIGTGEDSSNKVVAPGTKGTMATMKLSGTPEVAVRVNYKGNFALDDKWTVGNGKTFYCPLVIKVKSSNGNETEIKQNEQVNDKDTFENAVNSAIAAYSKEYASGTALSDQGNDSLTVSWEWPFSNEGNDTNDTALGDAADAATVTLGVTTTVTQID